MGLFDLFKKNNKNESTKTEENMVVADRSKAEFKEDNKVFDNENKEQENKQESRIENCAEYNIYVDESIDRKKLYEFINSFLEYVTPKKIGAYQYKSGHRYRFFPKRLPEAFWEEMDESNKRIHFELEGDDFEFLIKKQSWSKNLEISLSIKYNISERVFETIEAFILSEAMIASESDCIDDLNQNVKTVYLLENGKETEDPNQSGCIGFRAEPITGDFYKYPGKRFSNGLGAFYRMWFGKGAYELLDKDTLRNFPCYENIILDNDVTRITLYENILDYDLKENRDKQMAFRKALNIEKIAAKLKQEEEHDKKQNIDPEINIKEGNFEHGGVRLIQTYLKDGEIVHRSEADSVEERELDEKGKEVFSIIKDLR